MNLRTSFCIIWALLATMMACKPDQYADSPTPAGTGTSPDLSSPASGAVTGIGQPQGAPASQQIGTQGGTIRSADGVIELVIPAGALTKVTTITIQPITNQAPNGIGLAYRFSPDGIQFAKPATLTVHYDAKTVSVNDPDWLRVAFQAANQHWMAVGDSQVDTLKRQITVSMPHFSDWSAYEIAKLELVDVTAKSSHLALGTSTTLEVEQSLVEPLVNAQNQTLQIDNSKIKWSVVGGSANGQITAAAEKATYTAPARYPPQNPITVLVEIPFKNSARKVYMLKRILIGDDYFTGTFGGAAYNWSEMVCTNRNGMVIINGNNGSTQSLNIMLNLPESDKVVGAYPYAIGFKLGTAFAEYTASYTGNNGFLSFIYQCYMGEGDPPPPIVSDGNVTITQYDEVGGATYIKGYLSGTYNNLPGQCPSAIIQKPIQGEFRVRLAQ